MAATGQVMLGFTPGETVIVTGAGSGIGRSTAINAAAVGLTVAVWDVNADGAAATVRNIQQAGGKAVSVTANVTDDAQVEAALAASAQMGNVRYLVNNAGPASAAELDFDQAMLAGIGSMRRVTTAWLARGPVSGAALVNVASVAGNLIGSAPDWYPATKAAIMGYTRHLAAYRADAVRANAVAPGLTDTARMAGYADSDLGKRILGRIPLHRMASPDEISWGILFLLSPLASYVNGILLTMDGGWTITQ
ncbi:SDR family oxidoreductase [Trebonia kvetii]|uniref:SDR family oxidoreductase n=1 Tax=Trebonia kvetii TaxID=2480626 RepID=A0A6P2BSY7_9ACTN|nr:SDR family oxidoreductase [Trebonia kvetii]TVZ02144.1 SDR family oxidoreductase [Trebonia kvetii]